LVIFVFVCILMVLLILMQRPKQEGLGAAFGAGVTDQVFGARTTNVLQRGTVYLASAFFLISLALAVLIGVQNKPKILGKATPAAKLEEKAPAKAEEATQPKSLSEDLPAPNVPAAPAPVTPTPEPPAPVVPAPAAPETAPAAPEAPAAPQSADKAGQP
jgi:preprotein translocase subunit SecG